jgi:threonine aldolase
MIRLNCDYNEGAHPRILQRLNETNFVQTPGYGEDAFCEEAARLIRAQCDAPDADVHFLVGGTQTNLTVISAALRAHQCTIAANTGHINVHETGAIEATGHKVYAVPSGDGKLTAAQVQTEYDLHWGDDAHEHMVQPKLVYISNPTELGTLYSKADLEALSGVCKKLGLYLFLDGARLGYGLASPENDLDLPAIARLCDVFYIGGTKVGALFGEAVVITNPELKRDFRYIIKQKGGMLAKGWLLGVQFAELFRDNLYFKISAHAVRLALKLRDAFLALGYKPFVPSCTNQQFFILPDAALEQLSKNYSYSYQARVSPTQSAVRFCTSWATREEDIDAFIAELKALG